MNSALTTKLKIAFLLALASCSYKGKENDSSSGLELSDIKLETLEGKSIDLDSMKSKTIFINFWATWCKPCLQEMPSIEKVKRELTGKNIVFLFASNEEPDLIRTFRERQKFDFHYVRVTNFESLNIQALPTTYIFNPNGNLIFSETGYRDWSTEQNKNIIQPKSTYP